MKAQLANSTPFVGTADLILITGNTAHILDYKTSKLDPKYLPKNNKKYTKQLSLYAKLLMATRPEITNVTATLIYTRGLIQPLEVNFAIDEERSREIDKIKKDLRSGVLIHNTASCFLCRHPNCKFRGRESIWAADGSRKNRN
jgi:RecB family exonuclease